jgi:hypothetical protein
MAANSLLRKVNFHWETREEFHEDNEGTSLQHLP